MKEICILIDLGEEDIFICTFMTKETFSVGEEILLLFSEKFLKIPFRNPTKCFPP